MNPINKTNLYLAHSAALLLCCIPCKSALASVINWTGASGDWSTPANWSPGLPTSLDDAKINNGGNVSITANVVSKSVAIGSSGTLDNRLTVASGFTLTNTATGNLGQVAGSFGTATVDGTWALGLGGLNVGSAGTGALTISSGGKVTSASGSVGATLGGSGTATIAGSWTTTGAVSVGAAGTGFMTIATGGTVSSVGSTIGGSGTGTVEVAGTWNYAAANMTLGSASGGNGTITIQNGGKVTGSTNMNVGNAASSQGLITIQNGGLLEMTGGSFTVGSLGTGAVTVETGGKLATIGGNIGSKAGSVGTVRVSGTWANSSTVYIGAAGSGVDTGTGSLIVEDGGTVTNTAAYIGGVGAALPGLGGGSATVKDNGLWQTTSLQVGISTTGTLTIESGGTVNSTTGSIGVGAGSNGSASVAGIWGIAGGAAPDLSVGSSGTGSLLIKAGGKVTNRNGKIADALTSIGSVVVENSALWENSGTLNVGVNGNANLLIESGGTVTSVGDATVALSTSALANATVRGTWTVSGTSLAVGGNGDGTLTIGATGLVNVDSGAGTVYLAKTTNTAKGVLNIGAAVVNGAPNTAEAAGVLNASVVTGRATATTAPLLNFNHTNSRYVFENSAGQGISIQGKVNVNNYAGRTVLTGSNTYVGATTVHGGTLQFAKALSLYNDTPASWTAANLIVNSGATAAFNVGGTGEFTSANIDTLKALGTASGGFTTGSILGLDTTNASGGVFTYASDIANPNGGSNVLGLTKLGIGTLILSGANTYTGDTNINDGNLVVSGFIAGAVNVNNGGTLGADNGAIGGIVTVGNGATLYPGVTTTSLHILTIDNNVIFGEGSIFKINLDNAAHSDLLAISGTLTLDGNDTLALNLLNGTLAGGNYTIATFTSMTGTFTNVDPSIAEAGYQVVYNTDSIELRAVPEPQTWAMLVGGFGLLLGCQRMRRQARA